MFNEKISVLAVFENEKIYARLKNRDITQTISLPIMVSMFNIIKEEVYTLSFRISPVEGPTLIIDMPLIAKPKNSVDKGSNKGDFVGLNLYGDLSINIEAYGDYSMEVYLLKKGSILDTKTTYFQVIEGEN